MNSRNFLSVLFAGLIGHSIASAMMPTSPTPSASPSAAPPAAGQGPATATASQPDELSPWPITRYEKMIRKSPFAVATAAAPAPAATPSFAANLYLSGLAKIGDRDYASISTRDQTGKMSLFVGDTTSDGLQLVSVQWADAIGKSKVTVKKGSEFAVLEYDQAILQKPVQITNPGAPPMGQPAMPGHVNIPHPVTPGAGFASNPSYPPKPAFPANRNPVQPGMNPAQMNPQMNPVPVNPAGGPQPVIPVRRRGLIPNGR